MEIKFDVFWPKNLGTLYKDSSIDILGREFTVDLDLKEVKTILVEFKSDVKSFTDLAEIVDIEKRLVRVPFRGDATRYQGVTSFELVAIMKNGETKPSQTYTYSVVKSLKNHNDIKDESSYPILIELLQNVEGKISAVDSAIANIDNSINEMEKVIDSSLEEKSNIVISDMNKKIDVYVQNSDNNLNDKFENYSNTVNKNIDDILNKKIEDINEAIDSIPSKDELKGDKGDKGDMPSIAHLEDAIDNKISEIQDSYDSLEKIIIDENSSANLQNQINVVNSQLEHKANLNTVFSMANMGQDVKEAMTGGSVAIVGKNAILTENIVDNQVTMNKTDFFKRTIYNLFNKDDVLVNKGLNASGNIVDLNGYSVVNYFMKVDPNTVYYQNDKSRGAFYDINYNFISEKVFGVLSFTTPSNCFYYKTSCSNSSVSTFYVSHIDEFRSYGDNKVEIIDENLKELVTVQPLSIDEGKIKDKSISINKTQFFEIKKLNRFDRSSALANKIIDDKTGDVVDCDGYSVPSYFMSVNPGEYIYQSSSAKGAFYDINYKYVSGKAFNVYSFTVPHNAYYYKTAFENNKLSTSYVSVEDKYSDYNDEVFSISDTRISDYLLNLIRNNGSENPLLGKIISFNGDSMMAGTNNSNSFVKMIAEPNSMIWENRAVPGATVMSGTGKHCISEDIQNMREDADYIIIDGCFNDRSFAKDNLGAISSDWSQIGYDTSTFCGAFEHMLWSLVTRFNGKKYGYIYHHRIGSQKDELHDLVIQMLKKWSVPYIDLTECGGMLSVLKDINNKYIVNGDTVHPNDLGYEKYWLPKVVSFLKSL